ncbi:MAG: helicase C-terminal domain-containing protein, partial [Acidimicrobiia bacterium]
GYAQTIHTAQGHTYDRVHLYVDQMITAEHGYTGLSRATGETHIWMADPPGPTGDCGHLHCRPAVENRIDSLVRQLSNSGVRPAATESPSATETMTDRQLIDRREELFQLFKDGPLSAPTIDFAAVDQPMMEAEAMARRGHWIDDHLTLVDEYNDVLQEIDRRVAARTVLWQINPPEDVLAELGSRSESPNPQTWDAAVAVYARTRLEVGPEVDLLDPAVGQAGQWRDLVLQPVETPAPTLRLTG